MPTGNGNLDSVMGDPTIIGGQGVDTLVVDDSGNNTTVSPPTGRTYDVGFGSVAVEDGAGFAGVSYDTSVEKLTVNGTQDADIFNVTPSTTTAITINGDNPPFPQLINGGDQLIVGFGGVQGQKLTLDKPADGGGSWSFTSGQRPIVFTSIEQLQPFNPLESIPLIATAAAAGVGSKPLIKVYNASTNALLFSFYAFESTFTGGVRVSLANVYDSFGNLTDVDIIVAPGNGRLGEVKVYSGMALLAAASGTTPHLVANPDEDLISSQFTTSLYTTVGSASATIPGLAKGKTVVDSIGLNLGANTTISAIKVGAPTTLTLAAAAIGSGAFTAEIGSLIDVTTNGTTTATVATAAIAGGLAVGDSFFDNSNIADGTIITAISGTHITLSQAATGSSTVSTLVGSLVNLITTAGSKTATVPGLLVGQSISGPNIGADTTIKAITVGATATTMTLSAKTTGESQTVVGSPVIMTTTDGDPTVTVGITLGLTAGEAVAGPGIAPGTTISAIVDATTMTLSAPATDSGTNSIVVGFSIDMTTNGTAAATVASTIGLSAGDSVVGPNIPAGDTIMAILNSTHITLAMAATTSSTNAASTAGFLPEGFTYKTGLYVADGDFDGDGIPEIVTSRSTGVPEVRVFSGAQFTPYVPFTMPGYVTPVAFNPYTTKVVTGAQIAVGDVDGDGLPDIVTVPGSGQTVQVEVFNINSVETDLDGHLTVRPGYSFLGFESTFKKGASLALGDFDGAMTPSGTPIDEISLGAGTGGSSRVRTFDEFGDQLNQFQAFTASVSAPVQLGTVDVNGREELFVSQVSSGKTHLVQGFSFTDVPGSPFDKLSDSLVDSFLETDPAFTNGVFLG
jgi:hypothetical protein